MLQLEALSKRFGSTVAVDDLSLEVRKGEFLSLLGPSGCGKTTTLRMIAGFELPSSGRILMGEREVTRLPPQRRSMGMVFQNYALFPHLDVFENVAFGLKAQNSPAGDIRKKVAAALSRVDLAGFEKRAVQALSGGQQQRVALARALAPEPPLLLLDEPLSNLDAALRERTREELRALLKDVGITSIFVTHDQEEAFALSDRIAVLRDGRLQQLGTPEDLYRTPANAFVASFVGRANFLNGRVIERRGGTAIVELEGGAKWSATLHSNGGSSDRVRVMIRPESLRLAPRMADSGTADPTRASGREGAGRSDAHAGVVGSDETRRDGLPGQVKERRFAGAVTVYRVQVPGPTELIVTVPGRGEVYREDVIITAQDDPPLHAFVIED